MYMNYVDIFDIVVLSSLIGSVIVLLILSIKLMFKNRLTSTFQYYIWMILIVKLIIPFGPHYSFNISSIYEKFHTENTTNENASKILTKSLAKPQNTTSNSLISTNTTRSLDKNITNNTSLKPKVNIKKTLCFAWILGTIILAVILAMGCKKLKRIISFSEKDIQCSHKEILHSYTADMKIKSKLELLYSPQIGSPSICGIIKPKILIPKAEVDNINDKEFKYIIMHELFHLKNKDIIINWLITLLSILYWFNPILLYGFHKMRQDCEVSCDYQVISHLNKGENIQYGNTIIKILELSGSSRRLTGTTPMFTNSSEIKRRIIMISKYKKLNTRKILFGGMVIAAIGLLSIAINISNTSLHKTSSKVVKAQTKAPKVVKQNIIGVTSNENLLSDIKALKIDNTNSTSPFSSNIVVYNSHPDENYECASNVKVTDVGALINDKLIKNGLNSRFINCALPKDYLKSYQNSREVITRNVKNYRNTILLDVHRDSGKKIGSNTIIFVLTRKSPYYEKNLKFVNSIADYIKHSSNVKTSIYYYDYGILYYNQDLSNKSVLVEIGNDWSNDKDIENCVNAFVSALKNIAK